MDEAATIRLALAANATLADLRDQIGPAIRWRRQVQCMTGCELAKRTGVHQSFIANIEVGRRRCPAELLKRIAAELEISHDPAELGKETDDG